MNEPVVKVGLLYPLGGGEHEYYQVAEALDYRMRPYLLCAAIAGGQNSHDPEALRETGDVAALATSARSLATLAPDCAMWACTSGSFIVGRAHAEAQAEAIGAAAGCPASSTSLAFVHALAALGIADVAVIASYPRRTAEAFRAFLVEHDVTVHAMACLDAPNGRVAYHIPPERFLDEARRLDSPKVRAMLIPDTAVAGMPISVAIEREIGKPALSANQVTIWDAWRIAGSDLRVAGFGSLLERGAAAAH